MRSNWEGLEILQQEDLFLACVPVTFVETSHQMSDDNGEV